MKFEVGDKVVIQHSNDEGEVIEIINDKMVLVDVRGVRFPAYTDQLDFPYFKRFSQKTPAPPEKKPKKYIDQLPYPPYPVQEEALLAWFTHEQGVLVCAPTGTGKTLIAQAALFEALHTNTVAYYTTPLIALTEQKFQEMRAAAVRWGVISLQGPVQVGIGSAYRRTVRTVGIAGRSVRL